MTQALTPELAASLLPALGPPQTFMLPGKLVRAVSPGAQHVAPEPK